jgi:hypothetical protein
MPDKKLCFFISHRGAGDSPPNDEVDVVYKTLIKPTMARFPDFEVRWRGNFKVVGAGSPFIPPAGHTMEADLVIADLTELAAEGYYQVGLRQAIQQPLVLIAEADADQRVSLLTHQYISYPFTPSPPTAGDVSTIDNLEAAIREALAKEGGLAPFNVQLPTPKERRLELALRIDATADTIRLLRINSLGDSVAELVEIADSLRASDDPTDSPLQEAGKKALLVLSAVFDQLSTQAGARMAITGAVSLIVGGSGASGAAAFGAGLAFWYGKDVFTKFISAWGRRGAQLPKARRRTK